MQTLGFVAFLMFVLQETVEAIHNAYSGLLFGVFQCILTPGEWPCSALWKNRAIRHSTWSIHVQRINHEGTAQNKKAIVGSNSNGSCCGAVWAVTS